MAGRGGLGGWESGTSLAEATRIRSRCGLWLGKPELDPTKVSSRAAGAAEGGGLWSVLHQWGTTITRIGSGNRSIWAHVCTACIFGDGALWQKRPLYPFRLSFSGVVTRASWPMHTRPRLHLFFCPTYG